MTAFWALLFAIALSAATGTGDSCDSTGSNNTECDDGSALIQGPLRISLSGEAHPLAQSKGTLMDHDDVKPPIKLTQNDQVQLASGALQQWEHFNKKVAFAETVGYSNKSMNTIVAGVAVGILAMSAFLAIFGFYHLINLVLFVVYIALSSALLFVNRSLMHREAPLHPVVLVTLHMLACTLLTRMLSFAKPDLLPALQLMRTQSSKEQREVWRSALLIAVFFAFSLVAENSALFYSSVAFLQMIKESGIFFVATIAILFGLDVISFKRHGLLVVVVLGAVMCVDGELSFSLYGCLLQVLSNVANGMRLCLQQKVLVQDAGLKLDPLSYTALVSPCCLALLLLPFGAVYTTNYEAITALTHLRGTVVLSCMLAVGLNLLVAVLVQRVSAVGFCLLGAAKNAFIIMYSFSILGQETSPCQMTGCLLIFGTIIIYSIVKDYERIGQEQQKAPKTEKLSLDQPEPEPDEPSPVSAA